MTTRRLAYALRQRRSTAPSRRRSTRSIRRATRVPTYRNPAAQAQQAVAKPAVTHPYRWIAYTIGGVLLVAVVGIGFLVYEVSRCNPLSDNPCR